MPRGKDRQLLRLLPLRQRQGAAEQSVARLGALHPLDAAVARILGELSAGRSLPVIDALIAATAIAGDLTLVTRNTRHFELVPQLELENWVD